MLKNILLSNVVSRPFPSLKDLLLSSKIEKDKKDTIYFKYGRNALLSGLKLFEIPISSTIIVPSYMCNSFIQPVLDYGYKIIFQDINNELNFEIDELKKNILDSDAKAIIVVNFFGFKSNIDEIKNSLNLPSLIVIEDHSHSYLSNNAFSQPLLIPDMAIFSLRKNLPVINGGVLKINVNKNSSLIPKIDMLKKSTKLNTFTKIKNFKDSIFYILIRIIEFIVSSFGLFNIYSKKITNIKNSSTNHEKIYKPIKPSFMINAYTNSKKYEGKISQKILENYNNINKKMESLGFKPFFKDMSKNCVPQYAIFLDQSGELFDYLRENRIGVSRWPAHEIPKEVVNSKASFPNSNYFNNNLILLPIHQSIQNKHQKRILDTIASWQDEKV